MSRGRKPSEWANLKRRVTSSFRRATLNNIVPDRRLSSSIGLSPWDLATGSVASRASDFVLLGATHAASHTTRYGFARNSTVGGSRAGSPFLVRSPFLLAGTAIFIAADIILAIVVLKFL